MRHCVLCTPLLRSTRGACPSSSSVTNGAHSTYPHLLPYISGESFTLLHPFFDRITQSSYCPLTRTHWHSETLSNLSRLSLARTLGPIQRLELAGARHGAGAAAQPQGALAAHSRGVPPNRLRATPWLGATPPCQRPRVPPRRRRTRHAACSAALRRRARPLSRATPATYEDVSGGAHATSGVVRRTSALGAGSFWRTWRPH